MYQILNMKEPIIRFLPKQSGTISLSLSSQPVSHLFIMRNLKVTCKKIYYLLC
jgi:hypothetical protein